MALIVSASLSQVGEFSFILAALIAGTYKLLPDYAVNVITGTAIITITLNAALYRFVPQLIKAFEDRGIGIEGGDQTIPAPAEDRHRVIVVGYGPCGKILSDILAEYDIEVVVIEMNVDTVTRLKQQGIPALLGDARLRPILRSAGVEQAQAIIITSSAAPAKEIATAAKSINPSIGIMAYTTYIRNANALRSDGAESVFSGEEEVALSMMAKLLRGLGATEEQVTREREAIRERLTGHAPAA